MISSNRDLRLTGTRTSNATLGSVMATQQKYQDPEIFWAEFFFQGFIPSFQWSVVRDTLLSPLERAQIERATEAALN